MTSRLNSRLAKKKQTRKATKKPPIDHISRERSSIRCSISGADDFDLVCPVRSLGIRPLFPTSTRLLSAVAFRPRLGAPWRGLV